MTGSTSRPGSDLSPWWSLAAGLIFAAGALLAALVAGLDIGSLTAEERGQVNWGSLFVGVFLTGATLWWLVVPRRRRPTLRRGAIVGVLVGLASYPVVLAIAELVRRGGPLLESPGDRLLSVLERSALTLATTGFAGMAAMGIAGVIAALVLRRAHPPAPAQEPRAPSRLLRLTGIALAGIVVVLASAFVVLSLLPLDAAALQRRPPRPAIDTHEQAMAAFELVQQREAAMPLNPRCPSLLLTHGRKVERAVVFFHGFTNCPAQFDELAPQLFALGYNVYVPLLPRHGEADRMTLALAGLTAAELVGTTEDAIDLARGLGDEVVVAGLSGGGTMAAWAAQYRTDASGSIAMSPFLGAHVVPFWANRAAANLLLLLPNLMVPWDPREPEGAPAMDYAYPRYATHALAQFMRLGEIVGDAARAEAPLSPGPGMLLNDADFAISNAMAHRLIASWERNGTPVDVEVFPLALRLTHDLIDPRQPEARTDLVYPLLIEMIGRTGGTGSGQ